MPPESGETGALTVYSRPGCHLCDLLVEELMPMIRGRLELEVVDIDRSTELSAEYGTRIPVVEYNGRIICEHRLDRDAITAVLGERHDSRGAA